MVTLGDPLGPVPREQLDGLQRICEQMCAWIDECRAPDRSPARVYYVMFDGKAAPREAVVEAASQLGGDGSKALAELGEAIHDLVGFEYEHGVGFFDAAAATVGGDEDVRSLGARVDLAHRALASAWEDDPGANRFEYAIEHQRVAFKQIMEHDPLEAWGSFRSALAEWKAPTGEPGEREDQGQTSDEPVPDGCGRCFKNPDVLAGMDNDAHTRTDRLLDDSHRGISLHECRYCGQPSVTIFDEVVDWSGGDDAQSYTRIAITQKERDELRACTEREVDRRVRDLHGLRSRMRWSHPTGGRRSVHRSAPRTCAHCGSRVIAAQREARSGLKQFLLRLLDPEAAKWAAAQHWTCTGCGKENAW